MWPRRAFVGAALILSGMLWITAPPATAGGGCLHGTPPTDGGGTTIEMIEMCFTPTVLHASPGDTVTFVNRDAVDHTVSGVGGTWGTYDDLHPGDRVAYSFADNGVYVYVCLIHPGMAGAIVVGDGSGSAGLEPASVQPVATGNATAAVADVPAVSDTSGGMRAVLTGFGGLIAGMGIAAFTLVRRRRSAVARSGAGSR
jgi:plastocyanin